ncbi:MAG: hypothetical protein NTV46_21910 [Verrucomicrobia bacterium]|nr:hypothetical protein [Verrucomicrobiota bacterium]
MSIVTLELEEHLAETLARAAKASQKPLSVWVMERLRAAASEDLAIENGYPPGYWKLFAAMEDNSGFEAPPRGAVREVSGLDEN